MVFNPFKRKAKEKPAKEAQNREEPKLQAKSAEEKAAPVKKKAKNASVGSSVLQNPHITEKATALGETGQYVFRVHPQASKEAVKQSVEALYGVAVRNVRIMKKPAKKVRVGRREGIKQGLKKAVVQLKAGQTIEVISR